ncbi:hypothetical protein [Glutamicibacter mishrai]|uniref:hypothetical protein n=1 Tax=Glutamicibacter mishrai TaxID=1775880 RepID=UPI003F799D19
MILADEITCEVADANAVKIDLIDCSTSLIDSAKGVELMWIAIGAIGAFGAMVITIFMARYAWKAWNAAQKQNESTEKQIQLTRDLFIEAQRVPAVTDYINDLRRLCLYVDELDSAQQTKLSASLEHDAVRWMLTYPTTLERRSLEIISIRIGTATLEYIITDRNKEIAKLKDPEFDVEKIDGRLGEISKYLADVCEDMVARCIRLHHGQIAIEKFESELELSLEKLSGQLKYWKETCPV